MLEELKLHLRKGDAAVPLHQKEDDVRLCSFQVELRKASSSPAVALITQVSTDVWNRRLGHTDLRNIELLRRTDGNGVNYTGTVSGCDICDLGKNQQKAHPKATTHKADGPIQLVYTALIGRKITPAAKGGYASISKFTDDVSIIKEVFLLSFKPGLSSRPTCTA